MTTPPLDASATIPSVLRAAADRYGDRDYIVTPDRRLSFVDAELRSRRLAQRLLGAGVGKGTRVAYLMPQGPDFVVALLGITRIGAIAIPLSTFLRGPELRRAVRHTDVDTLIAPRNLLGQDTQELFEATWGELSGCTGTSVFLEEAPFLRHLWICGDSDRPWATPTPPISELDDDPTVSDAVLAQVEAEIQPSDLVVMISTSGSTGEPKAVVHTHGAEVRQGLAMARMNELDEHARSFSTMPFFWVGGLTVLLLSHLHAGAAVLTVERVDGRTMLDLIERERATRIMGWTIIERITNDPAHAGRDLRWLYDILTPSLRNPGWRHDSLGMSETSGPHTGVLDSENVVDLPESLKGSFGRSIPGVQHKVVDPETGETLPDGVHGEICVRGFNLMDGLYKHERADTFDADGWYHTGDRGFLRDGLLFFVGRLGEMIKTGGANVAPREVERAAESLPGVKAAFVVGLPDADRGQLVACLVCPEGADLDVDELTAQLREQLSSYKVPKRYKVVAYDDAPWLPSGKVSKPRIVDLFLAEDA